jgi:glycosyltransferase involved in cell wall biosynthesis
MNDIFPDSLIFAKGKNEGSLITRLLRFAEKKVYRSVTAINVLSGDMKQTEIQKGVSPCKLSVINNWVDCSDIRPVHKADNTLFDLFGLPREKFYVSYGGNMGLMQNPELMIRAIAHLPDDVRDIVFVFIGDGVKKPNTEQLSAVNTIKNVAFFPAQPQSEVSNVYSIGDIEIISLIQGATGIAFPSKLMSILAVGRPVICEADLHSELCALITENQLGICIAPNDAKAMAEAIAYLYHNPSMRHEMGERAREYAVKNFERVTQTRRLFELTLSLTSEKIANK